MNGRVNPSVPDGWVPEFAKDENNCFLVKPAANNLHADEKDGQKNKNLMDMLKKTVLPIVL